MNPASGSNITKSLIVDERGSSLASRKLQRSGGTMQNNQCNHPHTPEFFLEDKNA